MSLVRMLLGRRDFYQTEDVIEAVKTYEHFSAENENLTQAEALLVFKSDVQQCWLIFTSERMYFVIDDSEKNLLKVLWARDRDKSVKDNRIHLDLKSEDLSNKTGKVLIGNMNKGFMYTKSLFAGASITGKILKALNKHFLDESQL
ncbi:hypothetical protein AEST_19330 [Alishewanella aestuarii B11]|uniref:Uncharacterized protein n=1 Tax=Alishewanella aestuarii B11 TaxID=1197174 RepID=J1QIB4_9ALTE|nr:hypothetical protein [Alishewanella aestuarii]EJI85276.1 hypothetical protein AEST_19330 [Alishewanella aestuarii B11]